MHRSTRRCYRRASSPRIRTRSIASKHSPGRRAARTCSVARSWSVARRLRSRTRGSCARRRTSCSASRRCRCTLPPRRRPRRHAAPSWHSSRRRSRRDSCQADNSRAPVLARSRSWRLARALLDSAGMRFLIILALLFAPSLAAADDPKLPEVHARLVPAMQNGTMIGLKVYAIKDESRLRPAGVENGDTLLEVDGLGVLTVDGARAFYDRVIRGDADATIKVLRRGKPVALTSRRL